MERDELPLKVDIRANGKIAILVRNPRKSYQCRECKLTMEAREPHYTVTYGGAGLRNIKYPNRVCAGCLPTHMGMAPTWQERYDEWGRLLDWCRLNCAELEAKGRMRGLVICMQKIWRDMTKLREAAICSQ